LNRSMIIFTSLFCFPVFILFLACEDGNPAGASETTELEGDWSGYMVDDPSVSVGLEIHGSGVVYNYEGQEMYRAVFTLDKSITPHRLDGVITASTYSQYVGKNTLGIYQLSNDTLLVAGNKPGDPDRPTSFAPEGETMVMRLIRQ
jgi:uncharacterized protein (TIGR03067 family)